MSAASAAIERYRAARRDHGLAVLEGLHALKHALRFDARVIDIRTRDPERLEALARELAPDVADRILGRADRVDEALFHDLSPAPISTGVIALAERPPTDGAGLLGDPAAGRVVLLERPTHHGNIGAVVRVAAAAGAAGVLVTGPHDPWHPTAIRGGAGLQFALPVASLGMEGVDALAGMDRPVVALDPEGRPLPEAGALPDSALLAFGSERRGVSGALLARADLRVAIPMRPGVSSLNLATAVAITLYGGGG